MTDKDPRITEAEARIENTNAYEINPGEMAADVCESTDGDVDEHYVKNYIQDRMWYLRGA